MHNRNIFAFDIIHDDFSDLRALPAAVPEEKDVTALEGGLHRAGEHNDDGRGRVGEHGKTLPHHKCGGEDEGEVEELRGGLPGGGEGGEHGCGCGWWRVGRMGRTPERRSEEEGDCGGG